MRLIQSTPPGLAMSGVLALGSPIVTGLAFTSSFAPGQPVSGAGIPSFTRILSVDSVTQITLTANAATSGSASLFVAIEPVTLAEARLQVIQDSSFDDMLLVSYISACRAFCEKEVRQTFLTQSWRLYLDSFPSAGGYYNRAIREVWPSLGGMPSGLGFYPGMIPNSTGVIDIPNPPLQSIDSVQYFDFSNTLQTVDPTTYNVSEGTPARIQPAYSKVWPISRPTIDSVQVNFTCGYGDTADAIPAGPRDAIKTAILLGVAGLYANRGDSEAGMPEKTMRAVLSTIDHGAYS